MSQYVTLRGVIFDSDEALTGPDPGNSSYEPDRDAKISAAWMCASNSLARR